MQTIELTPPQTDKIQPHGYFRSYMKIAAELGPEADILELGVHNGESLKMWMALFPLGSVTGLDNNPDATWPEGSIKVVGSQADSNIADQLGLFNLIVDDASHLGWLTQQSFILLWNHLRPGGFYVVEDWQLALRSDDLWGSCWGPGMLKAVESFLLFLDTQTSEVEEIIYRYGLCIIRKRSA